MGKPVENAELELHFFLDPTYKLMYITLASFVAVDFMAFSVTLRKMRFPDGRYSPVSGVGVTCHS